MHDLQLSWIEASVLLERSFAAKTFRAQEDGASKESLAQDVITTHARTHASTKILCKSRGDSQCLALAFPCTRHATIASRNASKQASKHAHLLPAQRGYPMPSAGTLLCPIPQQQAVALQDPARGTNRCDRSSYWNSTQGSAQLRRIRIRRCTDTALRFVCFHSTCNGGRGREICM